MPWPEPVTLSGPHAQLKPLSQDHCDGLVEAVKDGELWKLWYTFIPKAEDMRREIDRRLRPRGVAAALVQSCEPARHRAAGSQTGWHSAQPSDRVERHAARYGRLQHHRQRMA